MTVVQPTPPKPKPRWFQYSLRTLMIVVTMFALLCSWFAVKLGQAKRQREAVEAIEKLGGVVTYDYEIGTTQNARPPEPLWLQQLLGDDFFSNIVAVNLSNRQVTDAGLEHLKGLTKLRTLYISRTQITDAGLEHLKGLAQLRMLSIIDTQITDTGLENLKGFTQLQGLWLGNTQVTDAGLEHLKRLNQLQTLNLFNTQVADAGLEHLKGLTQLLNLSLDNTQVTDAGVSKLQQALPKCKIEH